jgi:hypothetical protein
MRRRPILSAVVATLPVVVLLAACSNSFSPTDPAAHQTNTTPSLALTTEDSHGNSGGHGNGGGHGHRTAELSLQVRPDVWNTQYTVSEGTVQAFVFGTNLSQIDVSTIQLSGDGTGAPISPTSTRIAGNHLMATFSKQDAISLFPSAKAGEKHVVTLKFTDDGKAVSLTDNIRIVGPSSGD